MNDLENKIIQILVELYEHQTGEKFDCQLLTPEDPESTKEKTA